MTTNQAEKKVNKAIDAVCDLVEGGFGCDKTARVLEMLNALRTEIQSKDE